MTTDTPPPESTGQRASRHRRWRRHRRFPIGRPRGLLLAGVGVILLAAIALPVVLGGLSPTPTSVPPSLAAVASVAASPGPTTAAEASAPAPSPTPLGHAVVATRIVIDRLGIDLPIVEGDGVDAPLYKVAHYPGTAWPGGGSNIYLYGHARDGMFLSLWNAKLGDRIVLDLADGSQRTYVVTKIMPKVAWNDMALLAPTPHEQLTLQTCTSYEETAPRFVVIAVPAS